MSITLTTFNVNNLYRRCVDAGAGRFDDLPGERRALQAQAIRDSAGNRLPEVLCLQEVDGLRALRAFNEQHLEHHYRHAVLIESRDAGAIEVALLTTLPVFSIRSHVDMRDANDAAHPWMFSRDCLEVTVTTPVGRPLVLYVNHLESKQGPDAAASRGKRKRQADQVIKLFRDRFGGHADEAFYAVVGDLNDEPGSAPLARLVHDASLENVVARLAPEAQWTCYDAPISRVAQHDYLLLSPGLARATHGALPRISRGGIGPGDQALLHRHDDDSQPLAVDLRFPRFAGVSPTVSASTHCPLSIDVDL